MKIFLLLLFVSRLAISAEIPSDPHIYDEKPGPHGGRVFHTKHRSFEVSRKTTQKMLDVYVPKKEGSPPKNLQMTLLKSGKTDQALKLEPVASAPDDQFYHYQGTPPPIPNDTSVVPNEESQAAMGFTFDLDPEKK